jgi:hypothetical protein
MKEAGVVPAGFRARGELHRQGSKQRTNGARTAPKWERKDRVKKVLIVLSLAALLVMGIAATAQAHTLSKKRAANVARDVAQRDCNNDPGCEQYGAFKNDCKQASPHRVRCYALNLGRDSSGAQYFCERPVLVKMKNDSFKLLFVTGQRTCVFI